MAGGRAAASAQTGRPARPQAPPARGAPALPAFLHRSEQWLTCAQSRPHFLRQVKGSLQTTQIFVGRSDFLRIFGMGQPCGGGRFRSAVRPRPAAPAARAGPGRKMSAAPPGGKSPLPPASVAFGGRPAQRRGRQQPVPQASPAFPMACVAGASAFPVQNPDLAGALGFEPRYVGTKNRCLTTWRRPNCGGV